MLFNRLNRFEPCQCHVGPMETCDHHSALLPLVPHLHLNLLICLPFRLCHANICQPHRLPMGQDQALSLFSKAHHHHPAPCVTPIATAQGPRPWCESASSLEVVACPHINLRSTHKIQIGHTNLSPDL